MKELLKWPLIIAAIVVVLRVITEQLGVPESINNLISVVGLHFVLGPLYFAYRIARGRLPRPYATLFRSIALYVVLTRAMVIPVYWLGRIYEWPQSRFDGLWGPDITPFRGFVEVPFMTAAIWIVLSLVFGGLLGSILIAILSRFSRNTAAAGTPSRL